MYSTALPGCIMYVYQSQKITSGQRSISVQTTRRSGQKQCHADNNYAAKMPDWVSVEDIDVPLCQRPLSQKIDEASYCSLLSSAPDTRSRALALSSSIPHAGDWLNVVPSSALGLHLHDREFRLCVDYWLGLKMSDGESKCPLCAGECR